MAAAKPETNGLSEVKGGTGYYRLSPPWSREQVQWLGRGFFVLRIAGDGKSRWVLGARVAGQMIVAHERTFRRSVEDKTALLESLRMNLWPVHLAAPSEVADDPWCKALSDGVAGHEPVFNTDYLTLWRLETNPAAALLSALKRPFVVLDGHHSRRAQIALGQQRIFSWLEPLSAPELKVRSIDRAGFIAKWIEELLKNGTIKKAAAPAGDLSDWTMDRSRLFEVVQAHTRFWCEMKNVQAGECLLDTLARLSRGKAFLRTSSLQAELQSWLERTEVDTVLRLPQPVKEYVYARAFQKKLFPQKATHFYSKIPFGLLVEDLR